MKCLQEVAAVSILVIFPPLPPPNFFLLFLRPMPLHASCALGKEVTAIQAKAGHTVQRLTQPFWIEVHVASTVCRYKEYMHLRIDAIQHCSWWTHNKIMGAMLQVV